MKIAGSGALNLDLIYEVAELEAVSVSGITLRAGRETWGSHTQASALRQELEKKGRLIAKSGGGSAANTLCALARMGFDCFFIGSVGEDEEGSFILESMEGVDCSLVSRKGTSSLCIIVLGRNNKDRAMFVAPGPVSVDSSRKDLMRILKETDLFHFTSLVQPEGIPLQERLLSRTGGNAVISFDPGEIYAARGKQALKDLLIHTDLLFATDYELGQLFGSQREQDIIGCELAAANRKALMKYRFFRELSSPVIAKKMGSSGAALFFKNGDIFCPAQKVDDIVDNTGAGDAFNAGFLAALLGDKGGRQALEEGIGLAAASLRFPGRSWINGLSA